MKKSLLMLTLATSAMFAPSMASATAVDEIAGKYVAVGEPVSEITDGWYVLYNVGRDAYVSQETNGWYMRTGFPTDFSSENCAGYVYKVTAAGTDGAYNIMSGNGDYFNIGQSTCATSSEPVAYTIASHIAGKFYLQNQSNNIIVDGNAAGGTFVGWGTSAPTSSGNSTYEFRSVQFVEESQCLPVQKNAVNALIYKLQGFYGLVQNASNYVSNKKESSEGTYEALTDGDYSSYFHSAYQGDGWNSETHYLQANIGSEVGDFRFFTKKRSQNNNNRPTDITVQGATSADGEFTQIATITSGLPTDANDIAYLSDRISGGTNTNLRFVVNSTSTGTMFFTYSEFYVLPSNENVEKAAEIYSALSALSANDFDEIATQAAAIVALDETVQAEIDGQTTNVTFNFAAFGDNVLTLTVEEVKFGVDASTVIPSVAFFSDATISADDVTVSATNNTFTVTGTWAFPFVDGQVYRMDLRQSASNDCTNFYYDATTGKVNTRNSTDATAFVPERLFYLDANGFDAEGNLKVVLRSIAADATSGFYVSADNNSHGQFSETPTEFIVVTNATGSAGVTLQHPDNSSSHVNDISGILGIWSNGTSSQNDGGSYLRCITLTDDDFTSLTTGENADLFTQENIAAAKESKSAESVRKLFAAYQNAQNLVIIKTTAQNAITAAQQYTIGTGVGKYTAAEGVDIAELIAAVETAISGSDIDAITTATEALNAAVEALTLNMPEAGKFYRLQNVNSSNYLSAVVTNSRLQMQEDANGNKAETVFYYDGTYLVAWKDGMVVAKFLSGDNANSWKTVLKDNEKAGNVVFGEASEVGKYFVQPSDGRYIYGAGTAVDCGSSAGSNGYWWTISEVEWLPIVGSEKQLVAVCSPVALDPKDGVSTYGANIVTIDDVAKVNTEAIEGNAVPANVPTLLKFDEGVERDANTGLVYLRLNYEAPVAYAETATTTPLSGSFYAVAATEGQSYYTTQEHEITVSSGETSETKTAVDFMPYSSDDNVIPGFAAYISVASDQAPEYFEIIGDGSTGIEEIIADAYAGKTVIYDLQGRKLSAPVKGINIINGKKVLVK